MYKWPIMIVTVLLLSSCGLSKKFTRRASIDSVQINKDLKIDVSVAKDSSVRKDHQTNVNLVQRKTTITTVSKRPGETIKASGKLSPRALLKDSAGYRIVALFDSISGALEIEVTTPAIDDSTTTSIDESISSTEDRSSEEKTGAEKQNATIQQSENRTELQKKEVEKERKPSFWGTIGMWIGIAIASVAVLWLLFRKLLNR